MGGYTSIMHSSPSITGHDGRDGSGRFSKGNRHGGGNPIAKRVHRYRQAIVKAESAENVVKVIAKLRDDAMNAETVRDRATAAKVYLEYVVGKPADLAPASGDGGNYTFIFMDEQRSDAARKRAENLV